MSNIPYRPEIDGLRAVSVVGVVFFHAGFGFPGGYVGVDVFFVISGFLITCTILNNLQAASFSLIDFWVRRIRRILPAVSVMAAIVLVSGFLFLDLQTLKSLAGSSMAQSVLLSNVYFSRDVGYFAESADFKPLLHTWSLAVEEQFYFIFPFALTLAYRFIRKQVLLILSGVAFISLILSIYGTQNHESATFFLLPFRAWELFAGALLAVTQNKFNLPRRIAEIISSAGLFLIFATMFLYDKNTPFSGSHALLPVAGAVAFIACCNDNATQVGKLLSLRPIVFVGLISYSLYLWHWPLIVFANNLLIDVSVATRLVLVLISILFAFISWRFVETPFRKRSLRLKHSSVFIFGLVVSAVLFISSAVIWKLGSIPSRYSQELQPMVEDISLRGQEYTSKNNKAVAIGASRLDTNKLAPDFVFWGDSHGKAIVELVDIKAKEYGLSGEVYLKRGLIPITGLWRTIWDDTRKKEYLEYNYQILQSIMERKIPNLILVSRWAANCSGQNQFGIENGKTLYGSLVTDTNEINVTPEIASASVRRQLKKMIEYLSNSGTKIWLIKQIPETNNQNTARHFLLAKRFPLLNHLDRFTVSMDAHRHRQFHADNAFKGMELANLTIIDPSPLFFNNELRLEVYSERAHYRDDNHLTRYGAEKFLSPIFDDIFTEILDHKHD